MTIDDVISKYIDVGKSLLDIKKILISQGIDIPWIELKAIFSRILGEKGGIK